MTYVILSKPNCDVVPLSEMKQWLRVSSNSDDILIKSLIDSGVELAEKYMGRDILTTQYENYRESFYEDLTLRRGAFQSLDSIEYLVDGSYQTLNSSEYTITIGGIFGIVCDIKNVPGTDCDCNAVKITFKTGFGDDPSDVPESIKTAIKMYVSYLYENRGDCDCGTESGFPMSAQVLLKSYKIVCS